VSASLKRRWLLAPVAGLLILAAACNSGGEEATPTDTPPPEVTSTPVSQATQLPIISATTSTQQLSADRIVLSSNTSTTYYNVTGLTTGEIFAAIDRNGPRDDHGVKGSGLTAATWGYRWQPQNAPDGCVIASMTISLDIVVTLPRHQQESSLSSYISTKWDQFEASVAKHEQTHVDIDQAGARSIREKMTAIQSAANCDLLSKQVDTIWTTEQKAIESSQGRFHAQEDTRIANLRSPLQSQIDVNRSRIETLSGQIKTLDTSLASMNTELSNVSGQLDALKSQIDAILAQYPGQSLPPDVFTKYEDLRRLYNALAPNFNALVNQYNTTISQRNQVADEHDKLVDATNLLVDQFNWTR
jgi:predicted secreted Zn-dependent protease